MAHTGRHATTRTKNVFRSSPSSVAPTVQKRVACCARKISVDKTPQSVAANAKRVSCCARQTCSDKPPESVALNTFDRLFKQTRLAVCSNKRGSMFVQTNGDTVAGLAEPIAPLLGLAEPIAPLLGLAEPIAPLAALARPIAPLAALARP